MTDAILVISKYLIVIFMGFYVYESFMAIKARDELVQKRYCFKQSVLFYVIHGLCYLSIYLHVFKDKIVIFYGMQLIYFVLVIEINKLLYKKYNRQLLNAMCMMLMVGFTMLTRLSYDKAFRQFIICVSATIVAYGISFIMKKIKKLRNYSYIYATLGIGILLLVYIIGDVTNGAKISLDLGFISIQPSEFIKITYVMFISGILYKSQSWLGIITSGIFASIHVVVLVFSSDLGTALIFFTVYLFLVFMATGKYAILLGGLAAGSGAAFVAYKIFNHVRVRVAAWLDPWSIIDGKGYQIAQSLFAIGTGGLFGLGIYNGMPGTIPVVDQDFIFSAISEEFGAIFAICILLLSLNIFFIFIRTALRCKDNFYKLVCAGLAVSYGIQLFLTVGGAIKLIPSTGVTYPLLSYGGSSLMSTIFIFFIIQGVKINEEDER